MKKVWMLTIVVTSLFAERLSVDTEAITKAHNTLRAKHKVAPLIYTQALEDKAVLWGRDLQEEKGCRMVHSHGDTGENLYWASASKSANAKDKKGQWIWHSTLQKVSEQEVVQAWYDEIADYDYETNSCQEGKMCGHFTQVVWNTTTEVGCAAFACDDRSQVWVCEYAPAGNVSVRHLNGKVEKLKPY